MNFIKRLLFYWRWARRQVELYPLGNGEAEHFLKNKFKKLDYFECLDELYFASNYEMSQLVVAAVPIRFQKYVKEEHDCENFAYEFYALVKRGFPRIPIGICHVDRKDGKHALNFILYKTKSGRLSFSFIEPQTGKMSYFNYKPYFMVM